MIKKTIALLYGGRSGEHEVSLRSAAFVWGNIDRSKYHLTLIGISKEGLWYLQPETISPKNGTMSLTMDEGEIVTAVPGRGLSHGGKLLSLDLVFPVLHGSFGEDGTVQGLMELLDIPYAGAGVTGCAVSMDKELIKMVWENAGLPVVPFIAFHKGEKTDPLPDEFQMKIKEFGLPLFVKPANTGSSLGVTRVDEWENLLPALNKALIYDSKVLVEPCVTAREIECSVIGNHTPRAFPPGEIVTRHTYYDYEAKYSDPNGAELLIPAPLSENISRRIMDIALKAYISAGLSGMARVDFFMEDDQTVRLNELNAIPGFTSISMYPMMCANGGLDNRALIDELIGLGLNRYEEKSSIRYSR